MRRFIAATLTAALVVIGLSAVLVGTASASTPVKTADTAACADARNTLATAQAQLNVVKLKVPPVATEIAAAEAAVTSARSLVNSVCGNGNNGGSHCTIDRNPQVPGCQNTGPIYGGGNGNWNDRLDGRYFRLDRGPALDVCDAGSSSYDVWLNRNSTYRDRIVRQLNAQRWNDLRRADCGVVVSNDGNCITYSTARDSIRTYANDYNRLNGLYRGDWQRLSRADRDNLARLYSAQQRYLNDWNSNLSRLRTICKDDTPPVTIINNVPPTVTVTQAPVAAPAPTYSGSIPSGSVNTGGWSAGFILAHNRAV